MDGLKIALRSWVTSHKFLFWTVVALIARAWVELLHAIHWHQEASRELLILKPRKPKDLYDAGYALFAYDLTVDCWVGHWRSPDARPGMLAGETFAWRNVWTGIPFHEVEFSDMPEISFKVRAVPRDWCLANLKLGEGAELKMAAAERAAQAVEESDAVQQAKVTAAIAASEEAERVAGADAAIAEANQATKH